MYVFIVILTTVFISLCITHRLVFMTLSSSSSVKFELNRYAIIYMNFLTSHTTAVLRWTKCQFLWQF
jgi:hypothetical protein